MPLIAHYHWNIPPTANSAEHTVTPQKLTAAQALLIHPHAWPIYRTMEMLPGPKEDQDSGDPFFDSDAPVRG